MYEGKPVIALGFKHDCIRVYRRTLDMMGSPEYLLLMVNPQKRMICVKTGDAEDPSAHKVAGWRRKHTYYELYSRPLMTALRGCGAWDPQKTYPLPGKMIDGKTAVFSWEAPETER